MAIGIGNLADSSSDPGPALARRITDLERLVRELAASNTLQAATINQGGVTVTQGGSVRVVDTDGVTVAQIGALPSPAFDRSDGPQPGVVLAREDGSHALVLADLNPLTPPFQQSLQTLDRQGNVIAADDTNSGMGIARPHLAVGPLLNTNTGTWPATSSTAWTTVANCYIERQHPGLTWTAFIYADASTTAQFRMLCAGTQIGATQTVSNNTFATWSDTQALPSSAAFGSVNLLELQAKTTAGTGSGRAQQLWLEAVQS